MEYEEVLAELPKAPKKPSFFKVPIDKLTQKLPDKYGFKEFNPSQQAMIDGLNDKRFWVHISARRTGKSSAAAVLAFAKLLEPNQQVLVVAPNFTLSSIIWEYVGQLIESFKIETTKSNEKDHIIQLVNGSTFRLLSAENRNSLVGRAANLLIVDEAALIKDDEYFTRDLRPALSTFPDSRALFISTPRGTENYLHGYYLRGQSGNEYPEWGSGLFPWHANPRLRPEDIEEAKRSLPESVFLQEYYCDWASFEGQIYKVKDEKHFIDLTSEDAKYRITPGDQRFVYIAGLDMGFRDDTAFVVIATDEINYYIVDEYISNERPTSEHAEAIRQLIDKWGVETIYIDSAAQQTKADLAYDHEIYCENAIKSVNDGIAFIQTLVANDKLYADTNNCNATYNALTGYRWNNRTERIKPMHDKNSHPCDAVRYGIYSYAKGGLVDVYTSRQ